VTTSLPNPVNTSPVTKPAAALVNVSLLSLRRISPPISLLLVTRSILPPWANIASTSPNRKPVVDDGMYAAVIGKYAGVETDDFTGDSVGYRPIAVAALIDRVRLRLDPACVLMLAGRNAPTPVCVPKTWPLEPTISFAGSYLAAELDAVSGRIDNARADNPKYIDDVRPSAKKTNADL
jgi:hypothetical protein